MTDEQMNEFLESIGGLENGYFTDREPIKNCWIFESGNGWFPLIKELIEDLIALGWDKKTCQVLWVFGALERLSTLGFIENPQMQITQKAIDLFVQIDENRQILFDKDEHFVSLVKLVCKDFNVIEDQVDELLDLVRAYKDDRTKLVQFSLENSFV